MPLRRTIAAIAVVAAGAGVAMGATVPMASAADGAGTHGDETAVSTLHLLSETFSGTNLPPEFRLLDHAGLTNATDADFAPKPGTDHNNGNPAQDGNRRGSPQPSEDAPGFLQLTDNNHDKVGAVIYDHALPTTGGLDITFEMYQFNSSLKGDGSGADGIGFFLIDGQYEISRAGGYGGSLGYAQKRVGGTFATSDPGVVGGYLGVGFDTFGNFLTEGDGKDYECRGGKISETGCAYPTPLGGSGYFNQWTNASLFNSVTLRGPWKDENPYSGYEYLISTVKDIKQGKNYAPKLPAKLDAQLPGDPPPGGLSFETQPDAAQALLTSARRLVRVTVGTQACPASVGTGENAICPEVNVYINFDGAATTIDSSHRVVTYTMTDPMPRTFKFGFAGSTGHFTDVHLIRALEVSTLTEVPDKKIVLEKDVVAAPEGACRPDAEGASEYQKSARAYGQNDEICYRFTVTNWGSTPVTNVVLNDPRIDPESVRPRKVNELGPQGSGSDTAVFYAAYRVTAEDIASEPKKLTNTAYASGDEARSNDSTEVVSLETPPPEPCEADPTHPDCTDDPCDGEDPPSECNPTPTPGPDPSDWAEAVPLPPVGGTPSHVGLPALLVAAALTAYLTATSRRRRDSPIP